jgi:hypothetical protein
VRHWHLVRLADPFRLRVGAVPETRPPRAGGVRRTACPCPSPSPGRTGARARPASPG